MKKTYLILLLLSSLSQTSFAQKKSYTQLPDLESWVPKILSDWSAPGCAVAVVKDDKIIYASGFGYRDVEQKKKATANTVYQIGSSTKAFTGALLGCLEKEGLLDFDEKTTTYLPDAKFANEELSNSLTVRDWACHRSGLPRHDVSWYLNPTTRDSLVWRLRYLEPNAKPRTQWQYNNFGYLLMGAMAEHITGESWETNVRTRFFEPLEMNTANFEIWNMPLSADVAKPYSENKGMIKPMKYYHIEGMGPAGSIAASASEMANWMIAWLNEGMFHDKEVIPAAYVREAMSSQMVVNGAPPGKDMPDLFFSNYGIGWFLSSYKGHYRVEHGGNIDGFTASVCLFQPTNWALWCWSTKMLPALTPLSGIPLQINYWDFPPTTGIRTCWRQSKNRRPQQRPQLPMIAWGKNLVPRLLICWVNIPECTNTPLMG
ncbi:MAG: beta-lactamase family protein [Lewinellaceae bacterium]|nr:beta-lactamase family protein [Lewinellaceae bacterium]